ncbi:hypothetical protein B0T20DRAFT_250071 [Sordaria brevicollis]|uniref:Uncharacterized protein n=1 Tax=Sordaria brevicollis TaxID=83679 RepID=A0AAE0PC44_SORBR|nr:hypothetical protein B0T20DRAFT_250071 [Sordaria brevicollis]
MSTKSLLFPGGTTRALGRQSPVTRQPNPPGRSWSVLAILSALCKPERPLTLSLNVGLPRLGIPGIIGASGHNRNTPKPKQLLASAQAAAAVVETETAMTGRTEAGILPHAFPRNKPHVTRNQDGTIPARITTCAYASKLPASSSINFHHSLGKQSSSTTGDMCVRARMTLTSMLHQCLP